MFIRVLLWSIIIYMAYKFLKGMFRGGPSRTNQPPFINNNPPKNTPPPYDPGNVEDIQYKEVKRKKDDDNGSE